ncbi:uncharacterized protein TRIADDRAFT_61735 [Trichoplax adhaerens]|uniref:Uncharacterized protein n=1 Tax=Trichoplax adhaerens TaxID=10228 RepID=B3SBU1_TRIAD|nr:predicted protein [Trichoplax adhaerens]EDV19818.1 predicted protein [Trichoplax adhaerens]|eukprot:XP_002117688.1 predicted protein [Trichoplax adhaerens]
MEENNECIKTKSLKDLSYNLLVKLIQYERYMNEIENSLEYLNTIRRVQHYRQNHENYFDKSTKPRTHYENIDFVGVILVHVADIKEDCYNLHDVEKEVLNSVIAFDFRKAEGTVPVWGFDLPQPLAYLAACIYNGEIYITGGLNEDRQCSNKVWKLSRQSKT